MHPEKSSSLYFNSVELATEFGDELVNKFGQLASFDSNNIKRNKSKSIIRVLKDFNLKINN